MARFPWFKRALNCYSLFMELVTLSGQKGKSFLALGQRHSKQKCFYFMVFQPNCCAARSKLHSPVSEH